MYQTFEELMKIIRDGKEEPNDLLYKPKNGYNIIQIEAMKAAEKAIELWRST